MRFYDFKAYNEGMETPIHRLWVNALKRRYYRAYLSTDLFGQICLQCSWGSLDSLKGGSRVEYPTHWAEGLSRLDAIDKRRHQHGYANSKM